MNPILAIRNIDGIVPRICHLPVPAIVRVQVIREISAAVESAEHVDQEDMFSSAGSLLDHADDGFVEGDDSGFGGRVSGGYNLCHENCCVGTGCDDLINQTAKSLGCGTGLQGSVHVVSSGMEEHEVRSFGKGTFGVVGNLGDHCSVVSFVLIVRHIAGTGRTDVGDVVGWGELDEEVVAVAVSRCALEAISD